MSTRGLRGPSPGLLDVLLPTCFELIFLWMDFEPFQIRFCTVFCCFWMQRLPKRTSRGPRRLPRDTQRDTQRCPKLGQKVVEKWTQKWAKQTRFLCSKYRSDRLDSEAFLRPWGLLKTLTSKMSSRWPKNCSRCLKTVPKWFKNGSRLPKLFKIAPKIRPYKDL